MSFFNPTAYIPPEIQTLVLERINLVANGTIARHEFAMLPRAEVIGRIGIDCKTMDLLLSLETYVMGLPEKTIIIHEKWPTDWWQALKERWWPRWALRRWPVEYKHLDIHETIYKAVCPHVTSKENRLCFQWLSEK
jgi:hypothetical protein